MAVSQASKEVYQNANIDTELTEMKDLGLKLHEI